MKRWQHTGLRVELTEPSVHRIEIAYDYEAAEADIAAADFTQAAVRLITAERDYASPITKEMAIPS